MFVFPVDPQAQLPDVFRQHARLAESPAGLAPDAIEAGREQWLQAWTELMLR
jgi:thiamine transport system substrate-binding protein